MKSTERIVAPVRIVGSALLSAAVALTSTVAAAAPPAGEEQRYRELEVKSKLDLSREWAAYSRDAEPGPFVDYAQRRFQVRRDVGRGLVVAGAVSVTLGSFFAIYGLTDDYPRGRPSTVTGFTLIGLAGGLWLVGGILWGINSKRLDKLEDASLAFGPRGRVRLRSAAPILLPRGAGLGVSLSF